MRTFRAEINERENRKTIKILAKLRVVSLKKFDKSLFRLTRKKRSPKNKVINQSGDITNDTTIGS